jgi:hypothetical protein
MIAEINFRNGAPKAFVVGSRIFAGTINMRGAHSFRVLREKSGWRDSPLPLPTSLGVDQDGNFAVVLDGDGEVGDSVVVEIAGSDAVAAPVFNGVGSGDG